MDDEFLRFQNELLSLEAEFQVDQNHQASATVEAARAKPAEGRAEAEAEAESEARTETNNETKRPTKELPQQQSQNTSTIRQDAVCVGEKREARDEDEDKDGAAGKKPRYNDPVYSELNSYGRPAETKAVSDVKLLASSSRVNLAPKNAFKPIKIREGRPSTASPLPKKSVHSVKHNGIKPNDHQHFMVRETEHRPAASIVPSLQKSSVHLASSAPALAALSSTYQYPTAPMYAPNPSGAPAQQQAASLDPTIRTAAGKIWRDSTLTEFPENDFRIFVGNLGQEATREMLDEAFREYESFIMSRVVVDKKTSKCKGYGFVSFGHAKDMLAAIKEKNGSYVGSRPCLIRKSRWNERLLDQSKSAELNALKGLNRESR